MLLGIDVRNFGPFKDTVHLNMLSSSLTDRSDAVIRSDLTKNGILKSVTLFGPNASGKSYLFKAVSALIAVVNKRRTPDQPIHPYNPFRACRESIGEPTRLSVRMSIDNILYDYSVSYTDKRIESERLIYYPKRYPIEVFVRDRYGENEGMVETDKLTDTTTYLLSAAEFNDPVCSTVLKEIRRIMIIGDSFFPLDRSLGLIYERPELKPFVLDALDAADLGLSDINVHEKPYSFMTDEEDRFQHRRMDASMVHTFENQKGVKNEMVLPLELESNGTKEMLSIIVPVTICLMEGRTMFIDEFGSKLHHGLTRWIMNMFNSDMNRNGAQLIVNTHDLGLMDIRNLQRRDQIWFVNKSRETGCSELYSLRDFKGITKNTDVLSEYLDGRFDAVPYTVRRGIL